MTTGELDPRFVRTFRSTWGDTPSSHAVPHSTLTALGLTRGDYLDVKAWIFLVARKLQFENGERAAFKGATASIPKDDIPQVLASCCLKLTAQKMMNLEHACAPSLLAWLETAVFASLSSTESFSFRLLALSVFIFSYCRQSVMMRATLREILIALLGPDIISLAEPILAALKPRLLDDINDPRLALRAYLVGIHGRTNESPMSKIKAHLDFAF
ncbi:hypothetical protein, conserved [Eimeria brunetti]|uniref:Uncharacterized protein n=1 Tax=Eimeria brunetti TaxID=51314 RepID=U6LVL2_9EIME|nr:hypothetical protein, conserved [Eimeria brunetti]